MAMEHIPVIVKTVHVQPLRPRIVPEEQRPVVLRQCARFAVKNMEQWMPNIMPKQQCGRRPQIRISRNMTVVAL